MIPKIKLPQLYILPFLIILFILSFEQVTIELNKFKSFQTLAEETNALAEVDIRKMEKGVVAKVVDGDTIKLETGETIRYIGIDTPETKHPNKPIQCYGREASQKNTELVEGKTVFLEKDVTNKDRYDRFLRYIYIINPEATDEAIFVNEYLVEQGYARLYTYPPDVKYDQLIRNAETAAREGERGLWKACSY